MIPTTIQRVANSLKDELSKDYKYTYFLEVSSTLYMSPYLFQAEPQVDDFLACFDDGKILASNGHIEQLAKELGLILWPQGGLSKVNFVPSIFREILTKTKIDENPSPYFILTKDPFISANSNSLTEYWFAFPLKPVLNANPHKAIIRRSGC